MSDPGSELSFVPATFALHAYLDDDDETPVVVAWGMTLPDGSAVALGWENGDVHGYAHCRAVDRAAFIYGGEVAWISPAA